MKRCTVGLPCQVQSYQRHEEVYCRAALSGVRCQVKSYQWHEEVYCRAALSGEVIPAA